jgi:NAD(P)-dependent dehydrogenase (short-subunit alcohol dehydrogenase family)
MDSTPFIDFQGRQVLVTGASSGIGQAIAVELGRRNAKLILLGRNQDGLAKASAMIGQEQCHILPMDLAKTDAILAAVRSVVDQRGRIYGLCHAAGMVETRPMSAIKLDSLRAVMDINLTAGIEMARVVCRRDIMTDEGGAVLFISSIYARVGMAGQISYSASKGAVTAAARAMAVELARRKIRVNSLSPGLVHTQMTDVAFGKLAPSQVKGLEDSHPLGPGRPEDVARAAVFLLAPQNTWITGIDLVVDGGYTAR